MATKRKGSPVRKSERKTPARPKTTSEPGRRKAGSGGGMDTGPVAKKKSRSK